MSRVLRCASITIVSPSSHDRDRTAHRGFRRDVTDDEAVAAAREPPVGDQRDLVAEARGR